MEFGPTDHLARSQAMFTAVLLLTAMMMLAIVCRGAFSGKNLFTLQILFTLGTFAAAVGFVAVVWKRRILIHGVSVALALIGATSLLLMVIYPDPTVDPFLFRSGDWTRGAISLRLGWARLAMGVVLLLTGLALPFSQARRPMLALAAQTFVRASLWVGAFWQLAYIVLDGRFDRLFEGGAAVVQLCLLSVLVIAAAILLRGERPWKVKLTEADHAVSLARFVLPVALVPVVSAYLTRSSSRLGLFAPEVSPLLNIEVSSVTLLIVGAAALRSLRRERRSRESLANALERSPVMVCAEDGRIEHWPRACEELYGFTAAEAVGRRSSDLLRTQFPIPIKDLTASLRRQGEWSGELRQLTKGGKRLWIASRMVIDQRAADPDLKIVETVTDITDLKLTDAALSDTTDALAQAVATYGLGIMDHDVLAGRTRFSPELEHIVGLHRGALGSDQAAWMALMSTADAQRVTGWFYEDARNQSHRRTLTIKVRRADGEIRDLQGMVRYRYSPEGGLERVVGIYMDVTDQLRDRAEVAARGARLMELQSELTHISRLSAMGEMAAALAHELNQPLTAVGNSVGAIELIIKDETRPMDEKVRQRVLRAAKHAETQAVRAGEIVRRLREFIARGEADTQAENLDELIEDAIALALPNPSAAGVSVRKIIDARAATVLADRIQIQQVVVNLVRNAVEAMQHQSTPRELTITATVTAGAEGMALIRVSDTGVGVAPEGVESLFSPFLSTKRDGMGVGLSICRRIIEAHGGKMWFATAAGGGAEFHFTLPLISGEVRYVGT